jgi:hypothetical protein
MNIEAVATVDLKLAAAAWRRNAIKGAMHRAASGIFKWLIPEQDMSLYDRIDDLVAEVERLRWNEYLRKIKND